MTDPLTPEQRAQARACGLSAPLPNDQQCRTIRAACRSGSKTAAVPSGHKDAA